MLATEERGFYEHDSVRMAAWSHAGNRNIFT